MEKKVKKTKWLEVELSDIDNYASETEKAYCLKLSNNRAGDGLDGYKFWFPKKMVNLIVKSRKRILKLFFPESFEFKLFRGKSQLSFSAKEFKKIAW